MKLIYRIFRCSPDTRDGVVVATSILGILVNLVVATVKILLGAAVSSIAIVSEGINNATDSATSLITIIGTKLAARRPTEGHPFGYGRVEYLTSLGISVIILFTGYELLKSSILLIFHPAQMSISYVSIGVIALSAAVKLVLGSFTIKEGKRVDSSSLVALGTECCNDSVVSVVTILSALIFLIFHFSVDAYAGIFTSVFILKAGTEIIKETLSDLLGRPGDKELADRLYRIIRAEPIVINAADMMLHNYGPDSYSGSVNIEIDHSKTVGEIYSIIHGLQLKIMHEYNIVMVFGIYAVDQDHEQMRTLREQVAAFVRGEEYVKSYHALYIDPQNGDIYCDLTVDYKLKDWEGLREKFTAYMEGIYPGRRLELVIETDFV